MPAEPVCATCELHADAVLRVEEMDCNEEVVILEHRLRPLDGMEAIAAGVIGQRLHVKYDAAKLTTSAMVDAVGQTAHAGWLEHDQPLVSDPSIRARWRLIADRGGCDRGRSCGGNAAPTRDRYVFWLGGASGGGIFPARRDLTAIRSPAWTSRC